jgi:hypothetical protein
LSEKKFDLPKHVCINRGDGICLLCKKRIRYCKSCIHFNRRTWFCHHPKIYLTVNPDHEVCEEYEPKNKPQFAIKERLKVEVFNC